MALIQQSSASVDHLHWRPFHPASFFWCHHSQQFGATFGLVYGAILESFKNPPQPRPTDEVVLKPIRSNVMSKAMTTMGRQAFMLAAVSAVYSAGEVTRSPLIV